MGKLSHPAAGVHTIVKIHHFTDFHHTVNVNMSHLEVGHEVSEDRRTFLLQQALQADDEWNRVLNEGLLLDLWIKIEGKTEKCMISVLVNFCNKLQWSDIWVELAHL